MLKIILSVIVIGVLLYIFGVPTGSFSDIFLYLFILPLIWIIGKNIYKPSYISRLNTPATISGSVAGSLIFIGILIYFNGITDMAIFGYATFFLFFISIMGTQIEQKHQKVVDFFHGSLLSSFIFALIFMILLLI